MIRWLGYLAVLGAMMAPTTGGVVVGEDRFPEAEKKLIAERVMQYYSAVQSNDISKAKQYVFAKSRNAFFPQMDTKLVGYRVAEIQPEPGKESVVVKVVCQVMVAQVMQAVDVPQFQRWKLDSGEWYFDPVDAPKPLATVLKEYRGKRLAAGNRNVEFESQVHDFGVVVKGTTVQVKFAFVNKSGGDVTIDKLLLQEQLMKDATQHKRVAAGKRGEIVILLDTAPIYREFDHDILVLLEPIKEAVQLKVKGRVFTAKDLEAYRPSS
jgi:hypothetical protein